MEKRHVQTFLMISAAFFAMGLPVLHAQAGVVAAAVSRTLAQAGIGASPAEAWAASLGGAGARTSRFAARPIAQASREHATTAETAAAKRHELQIQADSAPNVLM